MSTAFISHPDCHDHDTGEGHPENAQRLSAIEEKANKRPKKAKTATF